jgi:hypothetical protein
MRFGLQPLLVCRNRCALFDLADNVIGWALFDLTDRKSFFASDEVGMALSLMREYCDTFIVSLSFRSSRR